MTDQTPAPAPDRPLVTFALFAYNQEQYIREAVEGAFSQTYEPLEIILSDDCSSDRTFEIMQEMAAAYEGPHEVRVTRTVQNLGVTPHVLLRGEEAKGEIVVVAAGDDISKPNRCSMHLPIYNDAAIMAVSGSYDLIGDRSEILKLNVASPVGRNALERQSKLFEHTKFPYAVIQGSTASYRRSVFSLNLPQKFEIKFSEDNLFNFLVYAHGYRVAIIDASLVKYRMHSKALSNHGHRKQISADIEERSWKAAITEIQKLIFFLWIAERTDKTCAVNIEEIEKRMREASTIEAWPHAGLFHRILSLASSLKSGDLSMTKWKMARLFGNFPNYQPKKISVNLRGR